VCQCIDPLHIRHLGIEQPGKNNRESMKKKRKEQDKRRKKKK
tara:strand:- start:142 stop:267 length:126 start_codon:yes stop_codon:yes gene_type:complete